MDMMQAIERRHSVRQYKKQRISADVADRLRAALDVCNRAGHLHMQLVLDEPEAFGGLRSKLMQFRNVTNYIVVAGRNSEDLRERAGYFGEKAVLFAQQLHLNTCWVGMTYKNIPDAYSLEEDERVVAVIAVGYGETQGKAHKSKAMCDVCDDSEVSRNVPDWYKRGVIAALKAPTAMNQQRFRFERNGNKVCVTNGRGPYSSLDLGIVRCHFETAAGRDCFEWVESFDEFEDTIE